MTSSTDGAGGSDGSPVAGWYADPTGPGERWWDGRRWTEHARAVPTPAAAWSVPVVTSATVTPAVPVTAPAGAWLPADVPANLADPGSSGTATTTYGGHVAQPGFGAPGGFGTPGAFGTTPGGFGTGPVAHPLPAAPWASTAYGPPPGNGSATASLVIGLAALVLGLTTGIVYGSLFGVVLGVRGLQRAKEIAAQGHPPVGRARAAWGLGLSVVMFVGVLALKLATV
ncbi:DUF2510 domain-containing protein [Cellulomonas carbonis]|uniref:DUF2510 domain-containing protein n=1 Tax=Cellulomonas carbonis T26 TaxID=947969 RepID=A0A0A0BWQ6_9CELL|nr:DUF2510 domain-containing protein [Cellulomonas carbonis]KGM12405.1 hypothetical protein N868_15060 [Cellulomonas carbonis T26]